MRRILYLIGVVGLASQAWAGEYAILTNGNRLPAERHEVDGGRIRLINKGGETLLPASLIDHFEDDGIPPVVETKPAPMIIVAPPAHPVRKTPAELASDAAQEFALPEAFIKSVMHAESGFQPGAISPKGAIGLMQLMPTTARELGVDPLDPAQNVSGGARYLRELLARYEGKPDQVLLALAAYNAGPAAVEKYHGVPPYPETRNYIARVVERWTRQNAAK